MIKQNKNIVIWVLSFYLAFIAINASGSDIEEGNELFVRQKYDEAISKYKSALEKSTDEDAPYIRFYLGRCYEMKNEWRKAFAEFDKVRTDYPKHPIINETIHEMGQCYVRFQQMDEAIESFDEVIKTSDDPWIKASSLLSKAILQCSSNKNVFNLDSAKKSLNSIISDYSYADIKTRAYYWLGYIHNIQKEYEKAIEAWENVIIEGPETLWADIVPWYISVARQKIGKATEVNKNNISNLRAQRFIEKFNEAAVNQNISNDTFYIITLEEPQKPGDLQLVEFGRSDTQGRKHDQYFMWAKSVRYENEKGVISGSGNVKIIDKMKLPQFILQAENIHISIDDMMVTASTAVNLTIRNAPKHGIDTEMKNHDFILINLHTKEFNIIKPAE